MAHARADNRYTRGLAEFVSGLRYERIPEEVRSRLKLLMLDSLGCALFGADLEWSRILRRTLAAVDTSRGATIWGTAERLSAPHAALVNGTAVQGFELDDVHRQGVLHVGAVTLPALFAAVETMAAPRRLQRPRPAARGRRRLRGRPARRHVHGAGAHRPGLAFGRHGRRVLRRGRRQRRARAQRRADRARARHRRHAVGRD